MKTALELLGDDWGYNDGRKEIFYQHEVDLIIKRAREEMRDAASREAEYFAENSSIARHIKRAIQSIPAEAKP